jgi:hypothetical protein
MFELKALFCEQTKKDILMKYFVSHKEYSEFPDANFFKRIISGEWYAPPHSRFYFYQNGNFELECNEFNEIKKTGKWLIKDNKSLWLMFLDRGIWEENKIKVIIFKESKSQYVEYKYSIEILFKEMKFWGDSLTIDFK